MSLLIRRADAMFEAADAVLCTDDPVRNPADLILAPEWRRSHGALYNGLSSGWFAVARATVRPRRPGVAAGAWGVPELGHRS